jgi:hypothetical protein
MQIRNLLNIVSKIFIVWMFLASISANAQVSKEDNSKTMRIKTLEHPYLFFTNEEKLTITERIKTNPQCKKIMEALLAEGHRFLRMPFEEKNLFQPEHPRYETSNEETSNYVTNIGRGALTLSFLYQMTGDVAYAQKAFQFAKALCNMPEWTNSAHEFDIIYPRVWPYNVPDDQVVFSYDINSARTTRLLATVYVCLYPVFTTPERDKIRNGLLEKAITRVRGNYDFFWWSTAYRCNWAAVCYSGLGVTAMSLLKENPQLIDVVTESYNRMNLVFDQIGEEGGWQEGRGYYVFMLENSLYFMDALKRLSNGKYNMFNHEKIHNHPLDFELYTLTAAFGDGDGRPVGSSFLINKLTDETKNSTSAWYGDKFIKDDFEVFDILWPRSIIPPIEPEQKSKVFHNIDWAVMRSDFLDPSTVTVACKAGFNNDPHHGHLDCGQFILTWQNVPFITEPGRMRYDEYYFNEERYGYPYASSLGHNVVFVNGEQQITAKKKNQPWKEGIGGKILAFESSDKRDYVLMDPTHAYPGKELRKWRRSIVLEKPALTVVLDEVGANPGSEIKARFFPGVGNRTGVEQGNFTSRMFARPNYDSHRFYTGGGEYKTMKNYVYLTDGKHNMAMIPLALDNVVSIVDDKIPTIPVTEDASLMWIPFVEMVTHAKTANSILVTILIPVADQNEAERIVKSAKINQLNADEINVSVDASAGNFNWVFKKDKEGYTLKN